MFRKTARRTLFSPPADLATRTDAGDKASSGSVGSRVVSTAVLSAIAFSALAPSVQAVSEVWQGRDEFVASGKPKGEP